MQDKTHPVWNSDWFTESECRRLLDRGVNDGFEGLWGGGGVIDKLEGLLGGGFAEGTDV